MNNNRQLVLGWIMYSGDYNDLLLASQVVNKPPITAPDGANRVPWVGGSFSDSIIQDDWDPTYYNPANPTFGLDRSPLIPLVKSREIFRCPSDTMTVAGHLRIRSYSMSGVFGTGNNTGPAGTWMLYGKQSQIRKPTDTWVFGEEHVNSINDASMSVRMIEDDATSGSWIDVPSSWHNRGCAFAYADGHAGIMKWRGSKEILPFSPTAVSTSTYHNVQVDNGSDAAALNDLKNLCRVTTVKQ